MLAFICLLAAVALATAVPASEHFNSAKIIEKTPALVEPQALTEHTFLTRLDHFRPQDGRRVNFTYTQNLAHYRPNGPIFVFVGDGGVYTTEWLVGGLIYDIASEVGGALVTADHRYFGKNIPTPTASFDDLKYLTVDQALSDLAVLITTVRRDLRTNGRVILWGATYGASLAAMARKKFPHLVDGVFASSALFRADAIDDHYYDNLSMIIREHGGTECADRVKSAFDELESLIANGASDLQARLRLCDPLDRTNHQEVGILMYRFIDLIAQYIHFNHINGLQNFCRDLNAYPDDPLASLIRWIEYAYGGRPECVTVKYDTVLSYIQQTNWTEFVGRAGATRAADYLACTQLGGRKVSSDLTVDIFPANAITEQFQDQFCRDVFGEQYSTENLARAVELLNLSYGGRDQRITHVVFSNAGLDPNNHHGIRDFDALESDVVFLQYYGSGTDLRSASSYDSINLAHAKQTIREHVLRWSRTYPFEEVQAGN